MADQQQHVPFALSPGVMHHAQIINYSTREGQRLFEVATKPLNHYFALDHKWLQAFLEQLGYQAKIMGWRHIIDLSPDFNNINRTTNLLTGIFSLDQVLHMQWLTSTETIVQLKILSSCTSGASLNHWRSRHNKQ
jgi:hypothetical protein